MTPRLTSAAARPSFASRVRRLLRRWWLDTLPVAGWLWAWREGRRVKRAAARRPQVAQLRPEFDPFEERTFLGLDVPSAVSVALVGTGLALAGDVLREALLHAATPPAPAPPGAAPQAAAALQAEGPPSPAFGSGGGGGAEREYGSRAVTPGDLPDGLITRLTSAGVSNLPGDSLDADPGQLGNSGGGPAQGGGGLPPRPDAPGDPAGGAGLGGGADPSGGGSSAGGGVPAPGGTAGPGTLGSPGPAGNLSNTGASSSGSPLSSAGAGGPGSSFPTSIPPGVGTAPGGAGAAAGPALPGGSAGGGGAGAAVGGGGATALHGPDATNVSRTYGSLPLPFEQNLGQTDTRVRFLSHGPGFGFFLTADGAATLNLTQPGQGASTGAALTGDALRLFFAGSATPTFVAQGQLPSYSNYFGGGSAPLSLTNVPQYGAVVERGVYPGIDVVWHSAPGRQLEYDFVVAPGADPSAIRLHIDGATGLSTDAQGDLLIQTVGGTLVQRAPVLTQAGATAGAAARPVAGSATLLANGDLGFQAGAYDKSKPLTIDPVIQYSSYLGGSGDDRAWAVAADGAGDAYVTGTTNSTNFPTTLGAYQTSATVNGASLALFVTKLNAAGTGYVYSTYLAGISLSVAHLYGVAVDAAGEAYVTGTTGSTSFPTTQGAFQTAAGSAGAGFVTKLNATGDALLYSTFFGNTNTSPAAIAVDPEGDAYVTGSTPASDGSSSFPTTSGAFETAAGSGTHAFVSELNASGSGLVYSSFLAGSGTDQGYGIAVDNAGDAYVTGSTTSTNFPTSAGAYKTGDTSSNSVAFVTKVNPSGSALGYSSYLGGTGGDQGNAIAVDGGGNAYVTGATSSVDFPTTASGFQTASGGGTGDAFVTKLNAAGGALTFSTYLGGSGADAGNGIAVDPSGYVVVAGNTASQAMMGHGGFPTTSGARQTGFGGGASDAFVTRLSPGGTSLSYSSYLGGSGNDYGTAVAVDAFGNAYPVGYTSSTNFPTASAVQGSSGGGANDAWAAKLSPLPAPPAFTSVTGVASAPTGEVTSSQNLTLSGTAAPSATVTVSRSDLGVLGTATANGSGNWSYTYGTTLAEGTYSFTATQTSGGVTSNPTSASGTTYVVAQDSSPFGAGWTFAPVDQLFSVSGGVIMAYGTGGNRYFASAGGGSYTSPAGDNGTLSQSGGTFTYSTPDGRTWTFNSSGYQTGWSSADGQSLLTYTYNGSNQLASMTAVDGTTTTFNYSGGKVSTIVTGNGRTTTLAYDASNNLTQVTNPDGGVRTFTYDASHHVMGQTFANLQNEWSYTNGALATLTWGSGSSPSVTGYVPAAVQGLSAAVRLAAAQQTDALGDVTQWQLDAQGWPTQETAPNGGVTTWARNASGYVTATTGPLGRTTTFALDGAGYVTQQTNPDGTTKGYQYQASFHALISATDERGQTTTYAYDSQGHRTSTTDALGDRTTSTYLANGLLQSVTDPRGNRTTYAYDTLRRLTAVTDALSEVTTTAYDANGFRQATTDPLGHTTTALHDVMGRVTGTIDPAGNRTTMTYSAAGLALTTTDALGRQTSTVYDSYNRGLVAEAIQAVGTAAQADTLTSYDAGGRMTQTRDADGWVTTYAYDRAGRQTSTTNALGGVSVSVYDLAGQQTASRTALGQQANSAYNLRGMLTQSMDALGEVTTSAYDAAGHLTSTTDPLGHTATTLYDALGRQTTTIDALGNRTTTTYDAAGNVSTVTDALGRVTSYAYDALNRATMTTEAVGTGVQRTTTVAYDAAGQMTSTTDALGHIATTLYDAAGRVTTTIDALGNRTTTTYDAAGNVSTVKDALGDVTTYAYDAQNRQTAVTNPLGHIATTVYDAAGNAVETIDALGDVTQSDYNALGELVAAVDGFGKVTQYGYDAAGDQVSLTDPDGNTTKWVYDALGRQVNEIDPFSNATTTAYDAAGQVTSITDQLGRAMTYAYDQANRLTSSTWKAAGGSTTNVQTFTYDAVNDQLTATDYNGTYTNSYDALNRLTGQTDPFGVALTYAYDAADRQTTVQDSLDGTTTSVYDNADRLTTREFGGPGQTPLRIDPGYDAANRLTGLTRYSNLAGTAMAATTSYSYDAASRVTAIVSRDATPATVSYYNYQYDNADRVTVQSGTGATGTYTYDADSQVLTDGTTTYSYDANGNRTMASYAVGTDNQVAGDGTWSYTYDAVGNMIQKSKGASQETWYYGYDDENHLTSVRQTTNGTMNELLVTYTYDVYDQRIQEVKWQSSPGTTTTEFVWSNGQVVMELNGSNAVQERYLWGDAVDQLFARIDGNGTAWWYLMDRLGSVRDVLSVSGVSQDHTDYTAYGVITSQTSTSAQGLYGFTSREYDAQTGLQYNRARYYNPSTGTWMSEDPSGFVAGDSNLYRYTRGTPLNSTDPTGLSPTTLTIDSVVPPYCSNEGNLEWFVRFELDQPADSPNGGVIIQDLDVTERVTILRGPVVRHYHYLEMWGVPANAPEPVHNTFATAPSGKKSLPLFQQAFPWGGFSNTTPSYDDVFSVFPWVAGGAVGAPPLGGANGRYNFIGNVYYVELDSPEPFHLCPPGTPGAAPGAVDLPSYDILNLMNRSGLSSVSILLTLLSEQGEITDFIGPVPHVLQAQWNTGSMSGNIIARTPRS